MHYHYLSLINGCENAYSLFDCVYLLTLCSIDIFASFIQNSAQMKQYQNSLNNRLQTLDVIYVQTKHIISITYVNMSQPY